MNDSPVVVVGLGFTGLRLARKLAGQRPVFGATRNPDRFEGLKKRALIVANFRSDVFPLGSIVVHTIPPIDDPDQTRVHEFLNAIEPRRIVYISATSVYGDQHLVEATSLALPSTPPGVRRRAEEMWIEAGPWTSLILRAAAIYGPGRGAHRRLQMPGLEVPDSMAKSRVPSGMVSRIHVDDLVELAKAGIDSDVIGAYPVADRLPCSTEEILRWSAEFIGVPYSEAPLSLTAGRAVDGTKIREVLGVPLKYPDYREGIPQCLREEAKIGSE